MAANLFKLKRLKDWIEVKIKTLSTQVPIKGNDDFSELNLSIEILNYLKEKIKEDIIHEEQLQSAFGPWYPDPMTPNYGNHITTSPNTAPQPSYCAICQTFDACVHNLYSNIKPK